LLAESTQTPIYYLPLCVFLSLVLVLLSMPMKSSRLPYILLTALLAGILQSFLPWWTLTFAAAAVAIYNKLKRRRDIFWSGFWGIALLWIAYVLFIELQTRAILSPKLGALLGLPAYPPSAWVVTALLGGITGGLAALTGYYLKRIFAKERKGYFY
jgi:hypothetical protein